MAETQLELTPEEEARIRWEQVLRGKPVGVVEPAPEMEEVIVVEETIAAPEVIENSPEAVLARLFKSMIKD